MLCAVVLTNISLSGSVIPSHGHVSDHVYCVGAVVRAVTGCNIRYDTIRMVPLMAGEVGSSVYKYISSVQFVYGSLDHTLTVHSSGSSLSRLASNRPG